MIQTARTQCRRGRLQFDEENNRYVLFWDGEAKHYYITDFYIGCQILIKCFGAKFNPNEAMM